MKILVCDNIWDSNSHPATKFPTVKCIADSALVAPGRPFFLPDFSDRWLIDAHIAVRVCRLGKNIAPRFASRYVDAISLMLRLTPASPEAKGIADIFDSALYLYPWQEYSPEQTPASTHAEILGKTTDLSGIDSLIADTISNISRYTTMKIGDIVIPCRLHAQTDAAIGSEFPARLFDTVLPAVRVK